jgi:hypothetical protein
VKPVRQFLVIPFYLVGFIFLALSIIVDLAGCAVALAGAWVEGA